MATGVHVRHAAPADMEGCRAIYALEVAEGTASFELEAPDLAEMVRRHAAVSAAGSVWLVAESDGAIAGYAYAGPYRPRPAYRHTLEDSVYIARRARGQRLGRLLLDRLVVETAGRGFREMVAVIGDSGNVASVALHAACGFRPVGTLENVGFKLGRWLDTVLMQRRLAG